MTDITVITPTWDFDRAIAQITRRRALETPHRTTDIVVWTGAPVPEPDRPHEWRHDDGSTVSLGPLIHEIDVKSDIPNLRVFACNVPLPPVEAMHIGALVHHRYTPSNLMMFLHDDVTILEPGWDTRILRLFFYNPLCGLAGFGGAWGLGRRDIYKTPYEVPQLVRVDYFSNADDWAVHGSQITGVLRVAVLDGLCLIFRPQAYAAMAEEGWLTCTRNFHIPFHMYDAWACLMMARTAWQTWVVGVKFHHDGGGTSVKFSAQYETMVKRLGFESGQELYESAHKTIYTEFQDLLPLRTA